MQAWFPCFFLGTIEAMCFCPEIIIYSMNPKYDFDPNMPPAEAK
jgi:hypothetical protein